MIVNKATPDKHCQRAIAANERFSIEVTP
jgi:hypothetical protein